MDLPIRIDGGDVFGGEIAWLVAYAQEDVGDFTCVFAEATVVIGAPYVAGVEVGGRDLHEVFEDILVAIEVIVGELHYWYCYLVLLNCSTLWVLFRIIYR